MAATTESAVKPQSQCENQGDDGLEHAAEVATIGAIHVGYKLARHVRTYAQMTDPAALQGLFGFLA